MKVVKLAEHDDDARRSSVEDILTMAREEIEKEQKAGNRVKMGVIALVVDEGGLDRVTLFKAGTNTFESLGLFASALFDEWNAVRR